MENAPKNTLSLVVITFNEEHNLPRCLQSTNGLVDEIIVLDSGSTDQTKNIAQAAGAKYHEHPFVGHIQQKNHALSFVETSWVLSLDADEALDETLREEIKKALIHPGASAYTMNRLTNYCGHWVKYCGWYPDQKLRLWKKDAGIWTGINPHDRFVLHNGMKPLHLKGNILHFSYQSVEQHRKQALKFAQIAAGQLHALGKRYPAWQAPLRAGFRFFRDFILKKGMLDGKTGFTICRISAWSTYKKYSLLAALNNG